MFPDITPMLCTMAVLLAIFVPLGLWKAVEIVIWLAHHIHIAML